MSKGVSWIRRAPKDPYARTVLSVEVLPKRHGGQLVRRLLECGHAHYATYRQSDPNVDRKSIRCRICIENDRAEHRAKSRIPGPAERAIDDYLNGRTDAGVFAAARRAIELETQP